MLHRNRQQLCNSGASTAVGSLSKRTYSVVQRSALWGKYHIFCLTVLFFPPGLVTLSVTTTTCRVTRGNVGQRAHSLRKQKKSTLEVIAVLLSWFSGVLLFVWTLLKWRTRS